LFGWAQREKSSGKVVWHKGFCGVRVKVSPHEQGIGTGKESQGRVVVFLQTRSGVQRRKKGPNNKNKKKIISYAVPSFWTGPKNLSHAV